MHQEHQKTVPTAILMAFFCVSHLVAVSGFWFLVSSEAKTHKGEARFLSFAGFAPVCLIFNTLIL